MVIGEVGMMIELRRSDLVFTFPEIHPDAELRITFERTLRIPDDGRTYPLPPGLGSFPLCHVDDFATTVPERWLTHGGIMFPMYQSEALWINFTSKYLEQHGTEYPFAVKIATGKINAVTGDEWTDNLTKKPQDYIVSPEQPWLDGYCVEKGLIRQFVAMPLGEGYSAEEQLTGSSKHGGLQLCVYPMKRKAFDKRFPEIVFERRHYEEKSFAQSDFCLSAPDMGLAPGGKMEQEIYEDPFKFREWDQSNGSRCFVHLTNSLVWRSITDKEPPTVPFTAREYTSAGLPWFDYYNDNAQSVHGPGKLKKLKSIVQMGKKKGKNPLPENNSVQIDNIIKLREKMSKNQVRDGSF